MFRHIAAFEARYHLKSPVFGLSAVLFFVLAFGAVTTDVIQIGGALGAVNRNAPYVIMNFLLVMSFIAAFVIVAFVAGAVLRDHEHGTASLLFSTPVRKRDYVLGRFAGAFGVSVLVMLGVGAAVALGGAMPWLDPERVGPFMPGAYLYAYAVLVIPNLFFLSALLFGLATLTRSMLGSYVGLVAFLVAYAVSMLFLADVERETLAALLDPFGGAAFAVATQYWTTFERNTQVLGLEGPILWNRLLWTGVALLVLGFTYARFRMTAEPKVGLLARVRRWLRARRARRTGAGAGPTARAPGPSTPGGAGPAVPVAPAGVAEGEAPAGAPEADPVRVRTGAGLDLGSLPAPTFGTGPAWAQFRRQTAFEIRGVLRSAPFIILLLLGVFNAIGGASVVEQFAGTPVHPRTHLMVQVIESSFLLFTVIILTFYAGELVFRERQAGVADIHDALPVPGAVYWGGKMVALVVVVFAVLAVGVLTTVGVQLAQGFTEIEPRVYLLGVGVVAGWPFVLIAVLALAAQVLTNQKYVGFLIVLLYFISTPVLDALGWQHNLYRYARGSPAPYSDMNGYGDFLAPRLWFMAYWSMAAVVLLVLVHLFQVRSRDTDVRSRLRTARRRLGPRSGAVLAVAVLAFIALGGWIFYNTNILNEYVPVERQRDRMAAYERQYGGYADVPQPRIVAAYSEVDLQPEARAVDVRGVYTLVNRTDRPLDSVHVSLSSDLEVRALRIPGGRPVLVDSVLGYRIYELEEPLAPGAMSSLEFELALRTAGFTNHAPNTDVVGNGTFINSWAYFPHIGYLARAELQDPNERRKRGLPPVERMPPLGDSANLHRTYVSGEADWIEFETVVSTTDGQIALAPGYREREWSENGRRYFHYTMDAPILPFWAYLSADWVVTRDRWEDVEIAVYHDPAHPYNIPRMIEAVKASLETFTRAFGPYQHRQVRIVEFPRYASFAQSFPNTIPFSESIGFIARLEDEDALDYVFYVTAHEVAHQWWAHQVIGANVQGATMLSETMAQYAALMVMEEEYGPEHMRRFLKYELDRYLEGRGSERIEELPLYLVENQPYIHYRKGSLAMWALQDQVGRDRLNREIRRYVEAVRFQDAPYTTSVELLAAFERAVDPGDGEEAAEGALSGTTDLIDDLFRTITLWDLIASSATARPTEDGRWEVELVVEARKLRATGEGREEDVPMDDQVDIGIFGAEREGAPPEGGVLSLEKRRITGGTDTLRIMVDREPVRAGIDPFNKLIDRNPDDNLTRVGREAGS